MFSRVASSVVVVALAAFGGMGCRGGPNKPSDAGVLGIPRAQLLNALGQCVRSRADGFLAKAELLKTATQTLQATPSADNQAAARAAFLEAMHSWQVSEAMQVGPAAMRSQPGGQDLRDNIYSWPLASRCFVEEMLVSEGYAQPTFESSLVNRRGLAALEYLLFYEGTDTACGAGSPIVINHTWADLTPEQLAERKRAYAAAASLDLRNRAQTLVDAWAPESGNFLGTLTTTGPSNTVFATDQAALNALSDSAFYVETLRDMKVGGPLGLYQCESTTCPDQVESRFAKTSKSNAQANLEGFKELMSGCGTENPLGFEDLLISLEQEPLAQTLISRIAAAEAAMNAVEEKDFEVTLTADYNSLLAVHTELRGITELLKTQFVSVLDLELPAALASDND